MVQQSQRLYKSRDDRFLFGVAGGLAEYFDIDPVLVRVGWVLLTVVTGGIAALVYLVMAIVTPSGRRRVSRRSESADDAASDYDDTAGDHPDSDDYDDFEDARHDRRHTARNVLAIGLIVIGMIVLLSNLGVFDAIRWDIIWLTVIVVLGIAILVPSIRR